MQLRIDTAKARDWQVIQRMNNQVFLNDKDNDDDLNLDWPFSKTGIDYYKRLAEGKYGKCLIAYADDKATGYVALAVKDFGYRKSKYIEIENIGVDSKYRSQGIGSLLMEAAAKWAKEKGATKLYVEAFWKNKKAIDFYKKGGFSEIGLQLDKKI